ncbi:MAG: hypothetical protein LBU32_30985 [Clostridiales bacterium]|nr:hypothetical protein [Clostridiales bacterium]
MADINFSIDLDVNSSIAYKTGIAIDFSDIKMHNITFTINLRNQRFPYPLNESGVYSLDLYKNGLLFFSQILERRNNSLLIELPKNIAERTGGDIEAALMHAKNYQQKNYGRFAFKLIDSEKKEISRNRDLLSNQAFLELSGLRAEISDVLECIEQLSNYISKIAPNIYASVEELSVKLDCMQKALDDIYARPSGAYWEA